MAVLLACVLACLLSMPSAMLLAANRKGDKLLNDARQEEAKGNLDHALQLAGQALEQDPSDPGYQLEVRRVRFEAGEMHVKNGQKLRNEGKLSEALAEFEKAYGTDPASDIAMQEIKRTREMIQRNSKAADSPGASRQEEEKTLTPSELAHKRAQERTDSLLPIPELRPLNTDLIDLKMTNQRPRVLFETVAKLAGINVLFDPEYDQQQTIRAQSIDLSRTTLDQALDQLSIISKSFWKPLSANTIFVTVDNPTKRREYAEQVVKVFYLSNVTAPQEMQEMLTVLRTVVDVQKVFSFTSQNALIVRAEADTMALVEKLISDLDKARPEVIIDVMVMEVNSTHMRNITAAFASTGITTSAIFAPRPGITTPGIQNATSSTPTTTTTGTTSTTTTPTTGTPTAGTPGTTDIPLNALSHISSADFSLTNLPGAALEAVLNDAFTKVLQAPQIRAVDNQKATLKIGEKVPTASGSFQPGVAGVGVSPLVNTQFTYLDVGVNMEVLPRVHENNEVSMHIDLDISQVDNYQNLGGISEPEIGQNKETADIRLREGEINLIGGIIQRTDTKSKTGIPGLANVPVLGRFFSGENIQDNRNELVIALIPHIVRGPDISASNLKPVAAGNATQIKVGYAPRTAPDLKAQNTNTVPAPPVAGPPATAPAPGQLAAFPPATAPPAPPATAPPATAPPGPIAAPGPAAAIGPARISFLPPTAETQLNSTITVTLAGDNINNMLSAAAQLRYDPRILRINNIVAGDLPLRGLAQGSATEPSKNILNDSGQADMAISRGASGGISGAGGLFTIVFQAVGRGNTTVSLSSVSLTPSGGQPIGTNAPPPLVINVK
ncbi:MAG: secretin N-terminal domain-containing protein [Bryobacteraceae bacterium]